MTMKGTGIETMTLETAAPLYDVKLSTLRLLCVRGDVVSTKVGKRRYVTRAAMDAVFKGEGARVAGAKRAST
jgi:hypothetical protein